MSGTAVTAKSALIFEYDHTPAGLLEDLGFTPVVVDISEFEKLEGCVTCLSVLLPAR
jgi:N-dimethylarginine dimethylaminohydrolase